MTFWWKLNIFIFDVILFLYKIFEITKRFPVYIFNAFGNLYQ